MSKEWIIAPQWAGRDDASRDWSVPPLVAQLLHNRRVTSADDARAFLDPRLTDLHPPHLLHGATEAAELIATRMQSGKRIVLYPDSVKSGTIAYPYK